MLSIVHSPCCQRAVSLCLRLESLLSLSRQAFLYLYALYRAPFVVEGVFAFAQVSMNELNELDLGIHMYCCAICNAFEFFTACSNNLTLDFLVIST